MPGTSQGTTWCSGTRSCRDRPGPSARGGGLVEGPAQPPRAYIRGLCMLFRRTEQWASMWVVPTHYLGLLLVSGRPGLAGRATFCVLVSNGPIPPLSGAGIQLILRLPFGL